MTVALAELPPSNPILSEVDPLVGEAPEAILSPGCALAIWRRPIPPAVAAAVAALDLAAVPPVAVSARIRDIAQALTAALALYPAVLRADVVALARRHAMLMQAAAVTVRLDPIATDACRRFHADYTTVRLLLTYAGPATQWVRAADPAAVQALATGDVGFFKGRLALEPPPILHRSPPIGDSGARRLLLVVDPVSVA